MSPAATLLSIALAAAFAWAALAKAAYWEAWNVALGSYRLPRAVGALAAPAVPAAELGVVALLLAGPAPIGGALVLLLLSSFSFAALRAQAASRSDRLPCGCFGRVKSRPFATFAVRNLLLGAMAGSLLVLGVSPALGPVSGAGGALVYGSGAVVAAALWATRRVLAGRAAPAARSPLSR